MLDTAAIGGHRGQQARRPAEKRAFSGDEILRNVRQKRRVTLAMLNVLAHILYEGGEYEAERSGMSSSLHDPGMEKITLAVTVDKDTFWQVWARLNKERGWRL